LCILAWPRSRSQRQRRQATSRIVSRSTRNAPFLKFLRRALQQVGSRKLAVLYIFSHHGCFSTRTTRTRPVASYFILAPAPTLVHRKLSPNPPTSILQPLMHAKMAAMTAPFTRDVTAREDKTNTSGTKTIAVAYIPDGTRERRTCLDVR